MRGRRWVHPRTHEIVKFLPTNPPERHDIVLVDGVRCEVLRAKVRWPYFDEIGIRGRQWEIYGKGVKVKPA